MKYVLFDKDTQAIIYGEQKNAIQRMLDFDYLCRRSKPSVAAVVNPTREGYIKVFFGTKEILLPVYRSLKEATKRHPEADVMINFSSYRSAYQTTMEAIETETIRTIAIIAEGIPERLERKMAKAAKQKNKWIIGPATVGGMRAGAFKIGNTGGALLTLLAASNTVSAPALVSTTPPPNIPASNKPKGGSKVFSVATIIASAKDCASLISGSASIPTERPYFS